MALLLTDGGEGRTERGVALSRADRQEAILAVTAAHLARTEHLSTAIERLAEGAAALLECASAVVVLRRGESPILEIAGVTGAIPVAVGETLPLDGHAVGAALSDPEPRVWPAHGESLELLGADLALPGRRSAVIAPLVARGNPFGALVVVSDSPDRWFSPPEAALLERLANQSSGIEAARSIEPLRQQIENSSIVTEVGRALAGTLGLDEVLALAVRSAEMLVNGQGAAVALIDEESARLSVQAVSGSLEGREGEMLARDGSLMGRAAATGELLVASCLATDDRCAEIERFPGAGIALPLESQARMRGVLFVVRPDDAPPLSTADEDALRKLVAHVAIAIDNAYLYHEQIQLSTALRTQATELEKAYADLSESHGRLITAEKMAALGRVTAGIAHEINSPLGGILNCLQMSLSYVDEYRSSIGDPDVSPDDHTAIARDLREALVLAEQSATKVAQFVQTIKAQTRVSNTSQCCEFDPSDEIDGAIILMQHELRDRKVTVHTEVEPGHELSGDPGQLVAVLQNLLSNAADSYDGEPGEVWIRLRSDADALVLEIEDHGRGIPEEIRGKVFDYLFTTKTVGQGTGLGLAMVHNIVTSHFGATVDFRTEVGVGSTFVVTFPVPEARV